MGSMFSSFVLLSVLLFLLLFFVISIFPCLLVQIVQFFLCIPLVFSVLYLFNLNF